MEQTGLCLLFILPAVYASLDWQVPIRSAAKDRRVLDSRGAIVSLPDPDHIMLPTNPVLPGLAQPPSKPVFHILSPPPSAVLDGDQILWIYENLERPAEYIVRRIIHDGHRIWNTERTSGHRFWCDSHQTILVQSLTKLNMEGVPGARGTKNKPGTKNVGRPRKDGQPTRLHLLQNQSHPMSRCQRQRSPRALISTIQASRFTRTNGGVASASHTGHATAVTEDHAHRARTVTENMVLGQSTLSPMRGHPAHIVHEHNRSLIQTT
ncbi:hypothetical protein EV363DRAFT_1304544 [Boletus edulis]|nr:hypothetical protein EV363DRAFT_1304544 [Boletus edulis]